MPDLMDMFEDLERNTTPKSKDNIIRAPFGYPGGKSRSVYNIVERLPYSNTYVEPFGGSAAVLLARHGSPLEIFNDRYAGVVAFYRCMRDPVKADALVKWLDMTVHSREDFVWCHETWENCSDDVERAARWFYMTKYSFASKGRNFGRSLTGRGNLSGKVRAALPLFPIIHDRMAGVQIENQDWYDCITDYDASDAVFYLDPPYIDAYRGTYKYEMTNDDHRRLLNLVFTSQGFFAISGYPNPLYENQDWDNRFEWEVFVSMRSEAFTEGNSKAHLESADKGNRGHAKEVLWIREAT